MSRIRTVFFLPVGGALAMFSMLMNSTYVFAIGLIPWQARATAIIDLLAVLLLLSASPQKSIDGNGFTASVHKLRWLFVGVCLLTSCGKLWATVRLFYMHM